MEEVLKWCLANKEIIYDIAKLAVSIGAFIYAAVVHAKSKKRLTVLEAENEVKSDLIKTITDLQKALEDSRKD